MLKIQSSRTREGREHPRRPLTTRWSGWRHFPDVSEWKTLGRVRPVVRTEILEKRKAMKCSMNKDDCQWGGRDGGDNFLSSIYRRGFFFSTFWAEKSEEEGKKTAQFFWHRSFVDFPNPLFFSVPYSLLIRRYPCCSDRKFVLSFPA